MIRHVAGLAEIVDDIEGAVAFYRDVLGMEVKYDAGEGYAEVAVTGVLHYGLWQRSSAAESLFGDASAVDRVPLGFTVGFEVDDVDQSHAGMGERGLRFLQGPKTEPWGQKTARFVTPGGGLSEVSETPWARTISQQLSAEPAS